MKIGIKNQAVNVYRKVSGGQLRERSQLCLVATEDGRLIEKELNVLLACIEDPSTQLAWLEKADCQIQNKVDGKWYQVIGERSVAPLPFRGIPVNLESLELLIQGIYARAVEAAKAKKYNDAKENKNWNRFVWLTSAVVVAAIAMLAMRGFFGGF